MTQLYLTEFFASVQGESSLAGLPTFFIRLSGCHLRCSWCDTDYSFSKGTRYSIEEILSEVKTAQIKNICITGGEPLLQKNVFDLMKILCDLNYAVSLETSGACSTELVDPRVKVILDVKCPGSQMAEKHDWNNMARLKAQDEVKFVISNRRDYEYAVDICRRYDLFEAPQELLFSPSFEELKATELIEWILSDHLSVRLNLQVHKWIWEPATRGV